MSPMNPHGLKTWIASHRRIFAVAIMLAAVAAATSLHLLQADSSQQPSPEASPTASTGGTTSIDNPDPTTTSSGKPPAGQGTIPPSEDPDVFARSVAEALFAWDTTSSNLPDMTEQLLTVADPTGEETPGLLIDLQTYLPSPKAWTHLAQYQTRQSLEVTDIVEPAAWRQALAQAPEGAVAEGTTARTVTGVRHRAGTWDGGPAAASSQVQFTIFMVCGSAHDQCQLLRLSTSDAALR